MWVFIFDWEMLRVSCFAPSFITCSDCEQGLTGFSCPLQIIEHILQEAGQGTSSRWWRVWRVDGGRVVEEEEQWGSGLNGWLWKVISGKLIGVNGLCKQWNVW